MAQKSDRIDRLFPRTPSDVPAWMAIRDADAKRRRENQARLKAARLARDAGHEQPVGSAPAKRKAKAKAPPAQPKAAG